MTCAISFFDHSPRRLPVVITNIRSRTRILACSFSSYTMTFISDKYSEQRWSNHGSNTTWLNSFRKMATDVGDPPGPRVSPLRFMLRRYRLESIVYPPRTVTNTNRLDNWIPPHLCFLCPEEWGPSRRGDTFSSGHPWPLRVFASLGGETLADFSHFERVGFFVTPVKLPT